MKYNFVFTEVQTNLILKALTEVSIPWNQTNPLIQEIFSQSKTQVQAQSQLDELNQAKVIPIDKKEKD